MHCRWSAGSPYCGEQLGLLLFQLPLDLSNTGFSKSWPTVPPARSSSSPSHPKQGVCGAHGEVYQLTLQVTHITEVGTFWVEWFPICPWSSSLSSQVLVLLMLSYFPSISLPSCLCYKLQTHHHQMQKQQPQRNSLTRSQIAERQITLISPLFLITHMILFLLSNTNWHIPWYALNCVLQNDMLKS